MMLRHPRLLFGLEATLPSSLARAGGSACTTYKIIQMVVHWSCERRPTDSTFVDGELLAMMRAFDEFFVLQTSFRLECREQHHQRVGKPETTITICWW
mmetsp:Transcript_32937/g.48760  ORF Transcript_32937/g.48760 Transcript_32937/m.48760 type:complete len:98 (-) Transcript_32937:156-449(-)